MLRIGLELQGRNDHTVANIKNKRSCIKNWPVNLGVVVFTF